MINVGPVQTKYPTLNSFGNSLNLPKTNATAQVATKPADITTSNDTVELQDKKDTKPKSLKDRIANVWKFFSATGKMIGATAKGIFYGALSGVALLGGSWLFNSLPKAFAKEGPTLWNTIRHPLKHIGKSGKIIAGVGSALVLAYHLIAGKLGANQRTAVIDHKMNTGHRDK